MTEITAAQSEVILVEAPDQIVAIVPQPQAVVIEVRRGPAGPRGQTDYPAGANTGDIIRYNAATGDWESCAEPFEFKGIVLVPMALPGGVVAEGYVGYNAVDKGIYVQID